MGIYQAAQNMSVKHLQSGVCIELPPDVRERFSRLRQERSLLLERNTGQRREGCRGWSTDDGIRFVDGITLKQGNHMRN
jgi:hypothetical protein